MGSRLIYARKYLRQLLLPLFDNQGVVSVNWREDMFRVGEKVRKKDGSDWNGYTVVTVSDKSKDYKVYARETNTWCDVNRVVSVRDYERQQLSDAIDLLAKHNVCRNFCGDLWVAGRDKMPKDRLLTSLFPTETPQQKKLKELEEQQRKLADEQVQVAARMEELRNSL